MKPAMVAGIVLAVVFLGIAAYFAVPMQHVFTSDTAAHFRAHYKHVAVFVGLAIVTLIGARFAANAGSPKVA